MSNLASLHNARASGTARIVGGCRFATDDQKDRGLGPLILRKTRGYPLLAPNMSLEIARDTGLINGPTAQTLGSLGIETLREAWAKETMLKAPDAESVRNALEQLKGAYFTYVQTGKTPDGFGCAEGKPRWTMQPV